MIIANINREEEKLEDLKIDGKISVTTSEYNNRSAVPNPRVRRRKK
jgi:hypothetical protein